MKKLFVLILAIVFLLSGCKQSIETSNKDDMTIFENTSILLHFSTYGDKYNPKDEDNAMSHIYCIDESGNVNNDFYYNNEVRGEFTTQVSDGYVMCFGSTNILINKDNTEIYEQTAVSNNKTLRKVAKSPNKVGYIEEHDLAYSIINAGKITENYNMILRIQNSNIYYEVLIPYYVYDLVYVKEIDSFIYRTILDYENDIESKIVFGYVNYNEETEKYECDNTLMVSEVLPEEFMSIGLTSPISYVLDNYIYILSSSSTLDFQKQLTEAKMSNDVDAVEKLNEEYRIATITKISLIDGTIQDIIYISDELMLDETNNCILYAHTQVINDVFYVFTSEDSIIKFDINDYSIEEIEIKYDFSNTIHPLQLHIPYHEISSLKYSIIEYYASNFYIANVFNDGIIRVHKILEDGNVELVLETNERLKETIGTSKLLFNTIYFIN